MVGGALCLLLLHNGSEDKDARGLWIMDEVREGCLRQSAGNAQIDRNIAKFSEARRILPLPLMSGRTQGDEDVPHAEEERYTQWFGRVEITDRGVPLGDNALSRAVSQKEQLRRGILCSQEDARMERRSVEE